MAEPVEARATSHVPSPLRQTNVDRRLSGAEARGRQQSFKKSIPE